MKKKPTDIFYSLSEIVEIAPSENREQLLADIASGKTEHIEFDALVFKSGRNANLVRFREDDMPAFAKSFVNMPFLRNHDTYDIESRDGIIKASETESAGMRQTIRLTTRKGMNAYVEGQIDRFSIGWRAEKVLCSVCMNDYSNFERCSHIRGREYDGKLCELIMVKPKGIETSAVNNPAVDGTGLLQSLDEFKLSEINSGNPSAEINAKSVSSQKTKGGLMKKKVKVNVTNAEGVVETVEGTLAEQSPQEVELEATRAAAAELLGETERQAALDAQLQDGKETLIAVCDHLLTSGLATSRLPELTQERIRKQFKGKVFKAPELQAAISEAREEVAALSASALISGPGRVASMHNSADQFRLAVEDLFGMEREPAQANVKVHKLRGIQEAYLMATGDQQFMGGFYPEFSLVTANFPAIVANVMNKMLVKAWKDYEAVYGWWQNIVTVEHFTNLNQVSWVRTGTIASLPSVNERGEYTELAIGDNKETSDWGKYGGYVPLTIEAVLRDDLRAFTRMPREAALAGIRNISEQVAYIFTQNSGAGPTMADTGALFNATAQTTAGGHLNLLTTALGTDYTAWNAVATAMFKKKMLVKNATGYYGLGKPVGIKPSICLVPADLIAQAEALFIPRWASTVEAAVATKGGPTYGGKVLPLAVPEWTDATDWAAVIDPKMIPGVMIGEIFGLVPQIFSASSDTDPAMFANDESRVKVRQIITVGVADDMPLHKSNVA